MEEEGELIKRKPMVQRVGAIGGVEASTELEAEIDRARGGGQPLSSDLQQSMGKVMGADFRGVRVHTDARADDMNRRLEAKAFTTGQDLFFKKGEYQPVSRGGQELIAHELTHVAQQRNQVTVTLQLTGMKGPTLLEQDYLGEIDSVRQRLRSSIFDFVQQNYNTIGDYHYSELVDEFKTWVVRRNGRDVPSDLIAQILREDVYYYIEWNPAPPPFWSDDDSLCPYNHGYLNMTDVYLTRGRVVTIERGTQSDPEFRRGELCRQVPTWKWMLLVANGYTQGRGQLVTLWHSSIETPVLYVGYLEDCWTRVNEVLEASGEETYYRRLEEDLEKYAEKYEERGQGKWLIRAGLIDRENSTKRKQGYRMN